MLRYKLRSYADAGLHGYDGCDAAGFFVCYCAQCAQPYGVNGPAMWSRANGVKYGCVCLHVDKFAADNRRPAAIARLPEKTKTLQAGHFYNYETQKQKTREVSRNTEMQKYQQVDELLSEMKQLTGDSNNRAVPSSHNLLCIV